MIPALISALGVSKVIAVGAAVITVAGLLILVANTISGSGYAKAEADRLEAIAQRNAGELKRGRRLLLRMGEREKAAIRMLNAERAARMAQLPPSSGAKCPPGCIR